MSPEECSHSLQNECPISLKKEYQNGFERPQALLCGADFSNQDSGAYQYASVCAAQAIKLYYDPEDLCGEEWELKNEEIAALDLQGAASTMEVEEEVPDMNAEEMAKKGFYLVKSVIRRRYRHGWRFLNLWEGFGVEEATWEPFSAFVLPEGRLNSVLVDYLSQNNLGELLRLAETLASQKRQSCELCALLPDRNRGKKNTTKNFLNSWK